MPALEALKKAFDVIVVVVNYVIRADFICPWRLVLLCPYASFPDSAEHMHSLMVKIQ